MDFSVLRPKRPSKKAQPPAVEKPAAPVKKTPPPPPPHGPFSPLMSELHRMEGLRSFEYCNMTFLKVNFDDDRQYPPQYYHEYDHPQYHGPPSLQYHQGPPHFGLDHNYGPPPSQFGGPPPPDYYHGYPPRRIFQW